jgi:predicted ATPase
MLAEEHKQVGQIAEGLTAVAEALVAVDKSGERVCEAELYRLKGELSLKSRQVRSPESEAEESFLKALEIGRRQQAKSWELRAATSLARLWQQQVKRAAARQLLGEVYDWFTEGFDTPDLQEAATLLEVLR